MNVSQVIRYREQVEKQKVEEAKLVKMNGAEEQKVEKILNKNKGSSKVLGMMERFYSKA